MKNTLLLLAALLIFSLTTRAQGYIRGGGGAGFNATEDAFNIPALTVDSNNVVISQRTIFGSFGQGARFSLAGGYLITPYFGIELELYYFQGFKQEYGSNTGAFGTQYNRTGYSYQLRATPSLVVQAPIGTKWQPFARFGILIPLWGKTVLEESWQYTNNTSRAKQTDIDGKFSVGFESSVGLQYNINDKLGIYIQATYTGLRIKSEKASVTKDIETDANGNQTDLRPSTQTLEKEIIFQDELTQESNTSPLLSAFVQDLPRDIIIAVQGSNLDFDKPLNLPTQTSNFGAFTFSLGLRYTFGK